MKLIADKYLYCYFNGKHRCEKVIKILQDLETETLKTVLKQLDLSSGSARNALRLLIFTVNYKLANNIFNAQ
jgi:hypothetical protein